MHSKRQFPAVDFRADGPTADCASHALQPAHAGMFGANLLLTWRIDSKKRLNLDDEAERF